MIIDIILLFILKYEELPGWISIVVVVDLFLKALGITYRLYREGKETAYKEILLKQMKENE